MHLKIVDTVGIVLKILQIGYLWKMCSGDGCSSNPCLNDGQCNPSEDTEYSCFCLRGWTGKNCEHNLDNCQYGLCKNGGLCVDQINDRYVCECTENFVGTHCEFNNPCLKQRCLNGGKCRPLPDGNANCHCTKYFKGIFCEVRILSCPRELQRNRGMCRGHGVCRTKRNGGLRCKCDTGYQGNYCQHKLRRKIVMVCSNRHCLNGGICVVQTNGSLKCMCDKSYKGNRCEYQVDHSTEVSTRVNITIVSNQITTTPVTKYSPMTHCNSECEPLQNNGVCEKQCDNEECYYDGGDCDPWKRCKGQGVNHCQNVFRDMKCDPECNNVDCLFDGLDCDRSPCISNHLCSKVYQNGICNEQCNNPQCGFDGGDCQHKSTISLFTNIDNTQSCSTDSKHFELDLVLLTSINDFRMGQTNFLLTLGSIIKVVLTITKITETKFGSLSALLIKLRLRPSECIEYGGQCFSTLEQISNFIKAGILESGRLQLPFRIARVNSTVLSSVNPKMLQTNIYFVLFVSIGVTLIICLLVMGVLLREKWRKRATTVKSSGIWTPSEAYSTSTMSINTSHQRQMYSKSYNNKSVSQQDNWTSRVDFLKSSELEKEFHGNLGIVNRNRKHETANSDNNMFAFQSISDNLCNHDGINPASPTFAKLMNEPNSINYVNKFTDFEEISGDIGGYVNESGESLLHIASRMNSGADVINKLHNVSTNMLYSTDEWGRTPLSTAIASGSNESSEQLLTLESQTRKEIKQNKGRTVQDYNAWFGNGYNFVPRTTALIEAVKLNSADLITILLNEGSPVNMLDAMGRSVVHWLAIFDNILLLEKISHLRVFQKLVELKDYEEKTPLFLAAFEGSRNSVSFIVDYISTHSIKIDPISPCPKIIALERGFTEIANIIETAQIPKVQTSKAYKKRQLKDHNRFSKETLCPEQDSLRLEGVNECLIYSPVLDTSYHDWPDSVGSCLFALDSINGSSTNNMLESPTAERNPNYMFNKRKKTDKCYLSNSSSSNMSPQLTSLVNNTDFNCYNNNCNYSTINKRLDHAMNLGMYENDHHPKTRNFSYLN